MDVWDEVRFHAQVMGDARRTLMCEPHRADEFRAVIESMGVSATFTVAASAACPPGQVIVLDEQALNASFNQSMQRAARDGNRFRRP